MQTINKLVDISIVLFYRHLSLKQLRSQVVGSTEGPGLTRILDLKKPTLREICVRGTVGGAPTNVKIPHLNVHKPKIAILGSAVVKTA